jgi:glycosyltransferase involved in cell wall biosynthesis
MAYDANDWLMRTMTRECSRPTVTAVHSFEDCSMLQFEEAKRRGKACIYDMPIGYYPAWQETERRLAEKYSDWLPSTGLGSHQFARPEQKRREMELSDVVLVPSSFVRQTIHRFIDRKCVLAPYGVDAAFWRPSDAQRADRSLRFIYVGQASIRKGIPLLIEAWRAAELEEAELWLVGSWLLAEKTKHQLPENVRVFAACGRQQLRRLYQSSDVFVFPSYFEGFGLVLLEAMACGLPVLSSECTAAPDFLTAKSGSIVPAGNLEAWVEALREISGKRGQLVTMKQAARDVAVAKTWQRYREAVSVAVNDLFS